MKRKDNLYEDMCNIDNIMSVYNEVCKNTRNNRKVHKYKEYKCIYITRIYNILKNRAYVVGPYNRFTIYEPKERHIVSQSMQDKIVNHLVSRYILHPALLLCLLDTNVASREGLGTKKGLQLINEFHRKCKIKYGEYYILKCDISKFFSSIDKDILKEKLKRKIKDRDALKIVFDIIDSEPKGLGIGNMTSQILAIFYLNDLDHYVKEELKIKYYMRYQDDFILFHKSKKYLKYCLSQIEIFLNKEKLVLNKKTRIYKNTNSFIYLGRNKKGDYAKYRNVKRRLKKRYRLYKEGEIPLNSYIGSLISYEFLQKDFKDKVLKKNIVKKMP